MAPATRNEIASHARSILSLPWTDFILADAERIWEPAGWKSRGHEIAARRQNQLADGTGPASNLYASIGVVSPEATMARSACIWANPLWIYRRATTFLRSHLTAWPRNKWPQITVMAESTSLRPEKSR